MKISREDFNEAMRKGIAKGKEVNEKTISEMIEELLHMIEEAKNGKELI